ncbi:heat stress transcription factor A-4c-like [Prunus yedoensis var. nudiflora]|uniref:Heat stress transcription factor A-4c-like n=1 Tax=Prunus yedoensis var. nudiflora TaxID=2094558 RepID=A0A314YAK0_PRUYE|nr:heat stress transcription factor A-4c-like [Prunus yedoensis var. nudiflora]
MLERLIFRLFQTWLDESTSCVESAAISSIQLNVDAQPKSPGIDMNSEPAVVVASEPAAAVPPEPASSKQQSSKEQTSGITASAPTGVNDVFWEHFLTENPGSVEAQGSSFGKKGSDGRKNESKPGDHGKLWWNMRNVKYLTEQMGHLTPVEKT